MPVYDLNEYLLNGTRVGELLGWPNPEGLRPIIPIQQQPEPNSRNEVAPYMVYTVRTVHDPTNWWMNSDEVTYVIWGTSVDTLAEIANEIIDNCRAMDDSARDFNDFLINRGTDPDYIFHWVRLIGSFSPQPAGQEGGRLGWIITLRYEYSPAAGKHIG